MTIEKTLDRYQQNLKITSIDGKDYIKSYDTLVAEINFNRQTFKRIPWNVGGMKSSQTTNRHINYAASELNLIEDIR